MIVPDPNDLLAAAHDYVKRGWRVIPVHIPVVDGPHADREPIVSCSCGRAGCNSIGKHPTEARWQATPPMSGADVQATFEDGIHNIGIATGAPSGFWVLDIDTDKPGVTERARELTAANTKMPATRVVRTGGGGVQYYFAMPDFEVTNSAKRLPAGIDVRGTGGQVVAPPSVSGKGAYSVVLDAPLVRAPAWLEDLVRPLPPAAPVDLESLPKITDLPAGEQRRLGAYSDNVVHRELARLAECKAAGWGGPGWNDTTYQVACALIELANSPWSPLRLADAHELVLESAPRDPNFGDPEVEGCFTSALKTVDGRGRDLPPNRTPEITVIPGDPLTDPTAGAAPTPDGGTAPDDRTLVRRDWSDLGNARRLVDVAGHRLLYIPEAKEWAVYDAGVWRMQSGAGMTAAQEMIEGMVDRESHIYSDDPGGDDGTEPSERDRFFKWAKAQQMSARIDACVRQATGRPELLASMIDFDQDHDVLNVANGIVDLRNGVLADHSPTLLSMLQSPVRYDPTATAPTWQAFLERCLPDAAIRDYLQMVFGYSLTGSMDEQAMFLHHGSGANGKSVFLIVAAYVAGTYSQVVPRETLLAKGSTPEHPTSVARMRGRRFLQASETAAGRRLDEETVKGLTGGEQQTARFMGANFFDFTPTGKIHFVTNHLPRLTDAESIWRRLHLIAWTETIPVNERDPQLAAKIIEREAEGVLAWAVAGAQRWYELNAAGSLLVLPDSMKRDLAEYRSDQDILGEFITSRLQVDPEGYTAASDIYGAYQNWCFNSGIKAPMTAQDLTRALRERRFTPHRTAKSRGFRLRLLTVGHDVDSDQHDPLVTA